MLSTCFNFALKEATSEPEIQNVLMLLISLYGIWSLEKHLSFLYQGGFYIIYEVIIYIFVNNKIHVLCGV